MDCPDLDTLKSLVEDQLGPLESDAAEHVEACSTCQSRIEQILNGETDASEVIEHGSKASEKNKGWRAPPLADALESATHERYEIECELARGGMGVVYKAQDHELKRIVALKRLNPQHSLLPSMNARFTAEAQITGMLEHPGIVPVYSVSHDSYGRRQSCHSKLKLTRP